MASDPRTKAWAQTAQTLIKKLAVRNMEGYYCPTSQDAVELVMGMLKPGDSITWGGSETFKETGLKDALVEANSFKLLDRMTAHSDEEVQRMWCDRTSADWMFMSTNALTVQGELVNIDGNSDRLSLLLHGPKHVVVLVGMNKLVSDVDAGIKRVQTCACPPNAARFSAHTPCDVNGVCANCHAPGCMCCQIVVTRHSRHDGRIKVVLIGENLGF